MKYGSTCLQKSYSIFAIPIFLISLFVNGCKAKIPYDISSEFNNNPPYTIALMPAEGSGEDAQRIFIKVLAPKLKEKGYNPVILPVAKLEAEGLRGNKEDIVQFANTHNLDAVLFTHIEEWEKRNLKFYISFKVKADFEMFAGSSGERIWESNNRVVDSTKKIGIEMARIAEQRYFEPYVQRVVDVSFATLPDFPEEDIFNKMGKGSYDWLNKKKKQ